MEENNSNHDNAKKRAAEAEDKESPAAKKTKESSNDIILEPLTPTRDPCSSSYDLQANARHKKNDGKNVMWVIYLAIQETSGSQFAQCIRRCKSMAASNGNSEFADRLQMDGTRHVTLWEGKMTQTEAAEIELDNASTKLLPVSIRFGKWIPRGAYLQLDAATKKQLLDLVMELEGLPSGKASGAKHIGDHLSLYRCRGMKWQAFNHQCAKIRNDIPADGWGTVQGVSVRLKVMGSDYSHSRVLAGV